MIGILAEVLDCVQTNGKYAADVQEKTSDIIYLLLLS